MPIPNPNGGALTEEHVQIRESVRDFADREVLPVVAIFTYRIRTTQSSTFQHLQ